MPRVVFYSGHFQFGAAMREEWKPIKDYDGMYEVSNLGSVRSLDREIGYWRGGTRVWKGGPVATCLAKRGRLVVYLWKNNQRRALGVGRLVLEAFVGPCPPEMECCHFPDSDPCNCHLDNLRWDTKKANCQDKRAHGTYHIGEKHMGAKLTNALVRQIRRCKSAGETSRSISDDLRIGISTIQDVYKGRTWTHII